MTTRTLSAVLALLAATTTAVQAHDHDGSVGHFGSHNAKPRFIAGDIASRYYAAGTCPVAGVWCGESGDDLLTGGLGATEHRTLYVPD